MIQIFSIDILEYFFIVMGLQYEKINLVKFISRLNVSFCMFNYYIIS
jgi:hypothetical protein